MSLVDRLKKAREEGTTKSLHDETYWKTHDEMLGDKMAAAIDKFNFIRGHIRQGFKTLLDIGCGHGHFVAKCRKETIEAQGIDISEYALEHACEEAKPYLKNMSVAKMDFLEDSFGLVAALDICEHLFLNELEKAIPEISRVAKNFIVLRLPTPIWQGEPWVADYSRYGKLVESHVSVYPWEFWAKRFTALGKFRWLQTQLIQGISMETGLLYETATTWIIFGK